jgi:hypothetical protein
MLYIDFPSDIAEDKYNDKCRELAETLYWYIKQFGEITVGQLSRAFQKDREYIIDALYHLKYHERIIWDPEAPPPSKIKIPKLKLEIL